MKGIPYKNFIIINFVNLEAVFFFLMEIDIYVNDLKSVTLHNVSGPYPT